MTDPSTGLRLGDEFPPTTREQWRDAVDKVFTRGGKDLTAEQLEERFQRELVTHTVDGLVIQPIYTDLGDAPEPGVPGAAPFTRGADTLGHRAGGWGVRQRVVAAAETAAVASRVLEELERGATSVLLDLSDIDHVDVEYLDAVLDGVFLDLAPIVLTNAPNPSEAAEALLDLFRRREIATDTAIGTLGLDPIGRWATTASADPADELASAVELSTRSADAFPGVRTIVVDATVVHEAGGGDVEELAYAAAAGATYVRALVDAGMALDTAFSLIEFRYAATPDQFLTISKLRAARRMWHRIAEVSGADQTHAQCQHAVSSTAASSRYDIWVNMLRNTVECFGAGVGGADAVTILPHDDLVVAGGSELGRRMARNTQLVLIEESNLARVVDIAGGSWYVEQLTDQIADAAWSMVRELEAQGGLVDAIRNGVLQARIDDVRLRRDEAVATRRMPMTGVTEFPNVAETVAPPVPSAAESADPGGTAPPFAPLRPIRYADAVEAQRGRADQLAATGARPVVFLAALGSTASNAARVSFTRNLFEVGGFETIVSTSTLDADELRQSLDRSGAQLACICGSDAVYADHAVATAGALAGGPRRLYLAGRPRGMDDDLARAGVDEQLVAGGDVVATLRTALDTIGAPS